jgi:hypothetical protein
MHLKLLLTNVRMSRTIVRTYTRKQKTSRANLVRSFKEFSSWTGSDSEDQNGARNDFLLAATA